MAFRIRPGSAPPTPWWDQYKLPEPLALAVMLYPGLLSERIAAIFTDTPEMEATQLIASALAVTLVNLAIFFLLARLLARRFLAFQRQGIETTRFLVRPAAVVLITAISVATGVSWAVIDSTDALYKLGWTDVRSRSDLFSFAAGAAQDAHQWARVVTVKGVTYHGLLRRYDSSKNGGVWLWSPKFETPDARTRDRLGRFVDQCAGKACRIYIPCIDIGAMGKSSLYIPRDQIAVIEYRAPQKVGEQRVYTCDLMQEKPG